MKEELDLGEELSTTVEKVEENKELSKADKRNMWILLVAVCLWFMCFNAFETFNSTYATKYYSDYEVVESLTEEEFNALDEEGEPQVFYIIVNDEYEKAYEYKADETYYQVVTSGSGVASTGTIILTVTSVITFAVAGIFAAKFGRKLCVLVGVGLLVVGCFLIYILGAKFAAPSAIIYLYFVLLGIGWALINVNSYPMMVEMSSRGNIGKYTGYYYTASMLAQSFTPILLGAIIAFVPSITLKHLFLYSTIMAILAFAVTMLFKENNAKVKEIKVGLSALDQD